MQYSLEKISTVAMCDALLVLAEKEKENLERRKRNLGESITNFSERIDYISNELASVQPLLDTFTAAYHALPEGNINRVNMHVEVKRMEVRKAYLDKMAITCNLRALLAKQVHYNILDTQVLLMETYITAVQNKRTALINATLRVTRVKVQPGTGRPRLQAVSFSRTPVARQKSQSEKRPYSVRMFFPGLLLVHLKQQLKKKVYSFQARLSELHLKPALLFTRKCAYCLQCWNIVTRKPPRLLRWAG